MEYYILHHKGVKPHFILLRSMKGKVSRDLISRNFPLIKEETLIANSIHLSFNKSTKKELEEESIKGSPFTYYKEDFDLLRMAVNQTFSTGNRGGYCKLVTSEFAFCIDSEMLFIIRDHIINKERVLGIVKPYEEGNEKTELIE